MENKRKELEKENYKSYGIHTSGAVLYQKKLSSGHYLNIYEYDCPGEEAWLYSAEVGFFRNNKEYSLRVSLREFKNLRELEQNINEILEKL